MKNRTRRFKREIKLQGTATSRGIAIGKVFLFKQFSINISELNTKVSDVEHEINLFKSAVSKVLDQVKSAQQNSEAIYQDQFSDIFESQKAFLNDEVLQNEIIEQIRRTKNSAAHVVWQLLSEKSDYFMNLENTYFRERAYDVLDLKQKLIHALMGINIDYTLTTPSIVVAEMLTPSDTIEFNRNFILGFLTDKGGKTSHAAILASGLRIPAVVNGQNLSKILKQDDEIIIDGFNGTIILNPVDKTRRYYIGLQKKYQELDQQLLSQIHKKAVTGDKEKIELLANIEFLTEVKDVKNNYADGIGLFRTESIFIERKTMSGEEEQFTIYKKLAEQMEDQPVTIRTVDLGGDKLTERYHSENEINPFLGWRAIRYCLDNPDIFKIQLRAIYRASHYGNLKILLPMISSLEEIIQTRKLMQEVRDELTSKNIPFKKDLPLGVMIETPAAAISVPRFSKYVDYFSIGTNDLTQYILAIDRTNQKVSKSYNTFNPAVLHCIGYAIEAAIRNGIDITLCGEFGAEPEAIPLLLGMGLRSFSMNPYYLAEAKKIIRAVQVKDCRKLYETIKEMDTIEETESACHQFLKDKVPDLNLILE